MFGFGNDFYYLSTSQFWKGENMNDFLIVVDMQKDFIDGALPANNAMEIIPAVIEEIRKRDAYHVLFTLDTHHEDYLKTEEGKHLPIPHCIEGKPGHELYPTIEKEVRNSLKINKPTFASLVLVDALKKRIKSKEDTITLVGLCSDICVLANAILIKTYFRENPVRVIKDAVRGVTEKSNEEALDIMKSLQIDVL